jgi:hypothetical protein
VKTFFAIACCCIGLHFSAFGHSGRTDSQGGHYDRRTGEYHFHHGMGPHQHPGGVCPYSRDAAAYGQNNFFQKHPLLSIGGGLLICYWGWLGFNEWKQKRRR